MATHTFHNITTQSEEQLPDLIADILEEQGWSHYRVGTVTVDETPYPEEDGWTFPTVRADIVLSERAAAALAGSVNRYAHMFGFLSAAIQSQSIAVEHGATGGGLAYLDWLVRELDDTVRLVTA